MTDQTAGHERQTMPLAGVDGGKIVLSGQYPGAIEGGGFRKWFAWYPSDLEASLDGHFSSSELRAIADHMDRNGK